MKYYLTFLTILFIFRVQISSQNLINTLNNQLDICKTDSCRVRIQNLMLEELINIDEIKYEELSKKLFLNVNPSDSLNYLYSQFNFASYSINKSNLNKAFLILSDLRLIGLKSNNKHYLAYANYGLALYNYKTNNFKIASPLFFEALDFFEKLKNTKFISNCYYKIGSINYLLKNYTKTIEYSKKSLDIATLQDFSDLIIYNYINLGNVYSDLNKFDISLEYYRRALKISQEKNYTLLQAKVLNNLGTVFSSKNQPEDAEKYYKEALDIYLKNNKKEASVSCYVNIGNIHFNKNNYPEAKKNYLEALKYVDKNDLFYTENLFFNLGEVNHSLGDYDEAFKYQDSSMTIRDSIYSRESIKTLNEMQTKYETTKTKLELEKKELEANNKQLVIYAAFGGCLLLLGSVFFVFRGFKRQKRANIELEEKNSIIEEQKHVVEEKNKDISDSIRYAKRIQEAILPPDKMWYDVLPNSFVLYNPKDILSGDFYWLEQNDDFIFVAAADCTGHGVPGALMSIVNYNLLNKAVLEKNLTMPGEILDTVNFYLTHSLHQTYNESSIKDGMDITLLSINKKTNEVYFAGANNPIYIISSGNLQEVKADKFPVGAFIEENVQNFKSQKLNAKIGDIIYLFTDGYADQFGGPKGKKFKYKQLSDLLIENCNRPLSQQQSILQQQFTNWKGNLEQVDDVCVLGIKL